MKIDIVYNGKSTKLVKDRLQSSFVKAIKNSLFEALQPFFQLIFEREGELLFDIDEHYKDITLTSKNLTKVQVKEIEVAIKHILN